MAFVTPLSDWLTTTFPDLGCARVSIVDAGGARRELNVGTNDRATPADEAVQGSIVAALALL